MQKLLLFSLLLSAPIACPSQGAPPGPAFVVATVKPVESGPKASRFILMQGPHRFIEKDYTLKLLIAAAYNLNLRAVTRGPSWIETTHYDITALTPGVEQPSRDEQMAMLRSLLAERFRLSFHRESKVFSIYVLEQGKGGSRLKPSTAAATDQPQLVSTVYPERILLPARNATMAGFASVLQKAIVDRPVVDRTALTGRYDFDLEWAPDESQFGGAVSPSTDAAVPPLFTALQQQLGLRLVATHGPIETIVVDHAERPSAN